MWFPRPLRPITRVECYAQPLVERGFADAFRDAKISLPDYFNISVELEGERVRLPPPWSKAADAISAGDILAEARYQMSERAGMGMKPGDPASGTFFEWMPSHPQFVVQIRLTDRTLLYARQRQLQFIFGALIAVSSLAAVVGFIAAYRAFRRQQQLAEMKSNFVSSVSHELRAPIASVRLMAENLEGGKIPEPEKQREYFGFIAQECRRLSALVENVLDVSRIEQGRKQYEFEPTNLVALVRTTVKLMMPYAAEKGVQLEIISVAETGFELTVDGRAIQQALVNLIDNAIKHSAIGQTVAVGIKLQQDRLPARASFVCFRPGPRRSDRGAGKDF